MNSFVHLPTFTEQTRTNETYQRQNDDDQDETNDHIDDEFIHSTTVRL